MEYGRLIAKISRSVFVVVLQAADRQRAERL